MCNGDKKKMFTGIEYNFFNKMKCILQKYRQVWTTTPQCETIKYTQTNKMAFYLSLTQ